MNTQTKLDFTPGGDSQAKRARCQRLLAGIPKTTTAARLFDEAAQREAEKILFDCEREKQAEQLTTHPTELADSRLAL